MTMSYLIGLDQHKIRILSTNPILTKEGFSVSAELDLKRMLDSAAFLVTPEPPDWGQFPGYPGFSSLNLRSDPNIILDTVHVNDSYPSAADVNALDVQWAEIGIYLVKA